MTTITEVIAGLIVVGSVINSEVRTFRGKPPVRILGILGVVALLYLFFVPKTTDVRDAAFVACGIATQLLPMLLFDRDIAELRRKRESERKLRGAKNE